MKASSRGQSIFLTSARVPFPRGEIFLSFREARAPEYRRESIDIAGHIWVATFSLITCGSEGGCRIQR